MSYSLTHQYVHDIRDIRQFDNRRRHNLQENMKRPQGATNGKIREGVFEVSGLIDF